ncbi:MAG: cadherin-like beta sandwich domain-containing protein [Longicatena sp.]
MKFIEKGFIVFFAIIMAIGFPMITKNDKIFAASFSTSATPGTVGPGGSFTVNVSLPGDGTGRIFFSGNNATVSESDVYCDTNCSITAVAGSSGTASVVVQAGAAGGNDEVTDKDGNIISGQTTVSVAISAPSNGGGTQTKEEPKKVEENKNKDKDSSLSALSISAGKLSPEFVSETKSYSVDLPVGTTEVEVSATPKSAKASVSGTGKITLKPGENTIEVTCSAEDGSTSAYVIKANVSEKPITTLEFGDKKLGVINGDVVLSKMFTKQKIKIDGKEVDAWNSETLKMTLIYMQDEKSGEKNLYIYDTKKNEVTSIYKPFAYAGKNLVQIDVPKELQERVGMKFTTVKLGQYDLPGWKFDDKHFQDYALIYVMDEAGKTQYYQYYQKDDNLQLYSGAAAITQEYYEKIEKERNMMFIGVAVLGVISLILLILVILLFVKRRKTTKYEKVDMREQGFHKDLDVETQALSQKNIEE